MEELWKDVPLSSNPVALQSYDLHYSPAAHPHRAAVYLQDYLAGSVLQPPPHHTLGSSLEFTYLGGPGPPSNSNSGDDDPIGFSASGASKNNNNGGKWVTVGAPESAGDRRQRRMIKNRESAARSRARKQVYTIELELELAQLRRENQMLIKREQDLINDRLAMVAQVVLPDCSSRSRSTLQQQQEPKRCRSAPAP